MSQFSHTFSVLNQWWKAASGPMRAGTVTAAAFLVMVLFMTGRMNAPAQFVPLYQDIKPKAAAEIETVLHEHNISMQYAEQDGVVRVLPRDISEAVSAVEASGILTRVRQDAGSTEALDKIGLGTSTELEKKRILIADEGELSRALMHLDKISAASVTISPGNSTALFGDDVPPTASIMITPKLGETLNAAQVKGIVSYVARAVSGLTAKNITLVDQTGAALWNGAEGAPPMAAAAIEPQTVVAPLAPSPARTAQVATSATTARPAPHSSISADMMTWAQGRQLGLLATACAIIILLLLLQRWPKRQFAHSGAAANVTRANHLAKISRSAGSGQPIVDSGEYDLDASNDHHAQRWNLADLAYGASGPGNPRPDPRKAFLDDLDTDQIAALAAGEMPQTVAVVIAHLDADRSAELLARYPPDQRVDLSRRIVALTPLPSAVITDLEAGLREKQAKATGSVLADGGQNTANLRLDDGGKVLAASNAPITGDGLHGEYTDNKPRDREKLAA